jgi:hypothetical protein
MILDQDERLIRHIELAPQWSIQYRAFEIFLIGKNEKQEEVVLRNGIFEPMGDLYMQTYPRSSFTLERTAAQSLFDDLWKAGFRPTNEIGSEGQLAALQGHLEDMRKIAFQFLDDIRLEDDSLD